ncbi:MAG TPA: ATP-binding protein [Longimicrobium sp.]|jgi:PAS domain S-box-containing protein
MPKKERIFLAPGYPVPPMPADALIAPQHLRDSKILVADDDPSVILVLRRLLERAGYHRVTFTSQGSQVGILCVEIDPDLVIVDLRMPDRDGFEVVQEVRELTGGSVPILVVSGEDRSSVMHQALACGARDFLSKPFEPAEALLRIRNLLELRALHTSSLADAEARYRNLVEGATDLICQTDLWGRVSYANPAATALLGAELVGREFMELVRPDHRDEVRSFYCDQIRRRKPATVREIPLVLNGVERWIEQRAQLVVMLGKVQGLTGIARDVTERRAHEQLKDDLVSVVSHELRTPLTAIRGSLGLLCGGVLQAYPERAARMAQLALSNAERLGRLIDDMLDLEKLSSGKLEIDRRPFSLREIVKETVDTVRPLFEQGDLLLVVNVPDMIACVDPGRVGQVLTNLVSNAAKFSRRGGTVWIEADDVAGDLRLRVRDHGRGIPADKLESIFERFQQVDSSDSREKGGTGLGLPICRNIVKLHGGSVWAESSPGKGSTFTALFPGAVRMPAMV